VSGPLITVVGSVNLDFVATAATLPRAGETVGGAILARHPGGKGANQALAARRLGAEVRLLARVGDDAMADEALVLLGSGGVDLAACRRTFGAATGVALIAVAADGENQIVVAPGANDRLRPDDLADALEGAMMCQLEIPLDTVLHAVSHARGFVSVNLAPALAIPDLVLDHADLLIANQAEAAIYGERIHRSTAMVAITEGAAGATLFRSGQVLARATPPRVAAVDATGAGDAFAAALTLALVEGQPPERALRFACAAGALAVTRAGAQPSLPQRAEVEALLRA
jgi:ribokinase